ncbi:hypothetical protein PR048_002371 [Dryococelus australis]|uniref:Uncharacterized protein n=1 Tax=Dryococelus australis TaxID=614101 RepID=A0ABQ9ILH7_9NEOP|nr:hypothetical protein PR048_002371 [Dryococelus australis]
MYLPLKSYFLSQEKCRTVLNAFFSNECSELWLIFIYFLAVIFNDSVKIIEGDKTSFTKVSHLFVDLKNKHTNHLENDYIPLSIRSELKKLVESGQIDRSYFMGHIRNFYRNCIQYLQKYIHLYIKTKSEMGCVEQTYHQLMGQMLTTGMTLVKDSLFNKVSYVSNYIDHDVLKRWKEMKSSTEQ